MISNQTVTLPAGDTVTIELSISAPEGVEFEGATVFYAVSQKDSTPKLFTKTNGSGLDVEADAEGGGLLVKIYLTHLDTKDLRPTKYYHEATVVGGDGAVTTVMRGNLVLTPTLIARQLP